MMKKLITPIIPVLLAGLILNSCKKEDPDAPEACFAVPASIEAGMPAAFDASCSVNGISFNWEFGEGGSSSGASTFYTFSQAGTYVVSLTVESASGASDQFKLEITVDAPELIEHSGNITSNETWASGLHLVKSDVHVDGATLTIAEGATIAFESGSAIYVGYHSGHEGATLTAMGSASDPVTFRPSGDGTSGAWDMIGFYDNASSSSSLANCVIERGGGYSDNYGAIHVDGCGLSITDTRISMSGSIGISLADDAYFTEFRGNTLEDNAGAAIEIYANHVETIGTNNSISSDKGIMIKGDRIEKDAVTWLKHSVPYVVLGDIYVGTETGSILTLEPGVEIRMTGNTGMYFGYYGGTFGTLQAVGLETDPIKITSAAPMAARTPGDWDLLGFYDGAGNSSLMSHCVVEYGGGYSENYGMIYLDGAGLSLSNSTIMMSEYQGLRLTDDAMFMECTGNRFEDNGSYPIELSGNYAHTVGTGNVFVTGPGILVNGDRFEEAAETWLKQEIPYIIDGDLYVGHSTGAHLTIEPGTRVNFTEGSGLYVGYYSGTFGILEADASEGMEITFSTAAPSGFESAGDWDGIWFYDGTANGTILDHCIVSYGGGYGNNSGNLNVRTDALGIPVISNCQIMNSETWGIYLGNGANPTLESNTYKDNASGNESQ